MPDFVRFILNLYMNCSGAQPTPNRSHTTGRLWPTVPLRTPPCKRSP